MNEQTNKQDIPNARLRGVGGLEHREWGEGVGRRPRGSGAGHGMRERSSLNPHPRPRVGTPRVAALRCPPAIYLDVSCPALRAGRPGTPAYRMLPRLTLTLTLSHPSCGPTGPQAPLQDSVWGGQGPHQSGQIPTGCDHLPCPLMMLPGTAPPHLPMLAAGTRPDLVALNPV